MSSRSSCSEIFSAAQISAALRQPAGAAGLDQDARERHQPREPLRADRRVGTAPVGVVDARARSLAHGRSGCDGAVLGAIGSATWGSPVWRSTSSASALAQLGDQLGRADDPGVVAEPEHPGDQLARVRVLGDEQTVARLGLIARAADLAVAAEVALDLPRDPLADPDLGRADRLAELPVDAVGVGARIEVRGPLEVVLGLGRVADLAADPREPEDADRARARASGRRRRTGRPG